MNDMEKERAIEQWLDSAIQQYGRAEPREGLETRLLAGLRAERDRLDRGSRWTWAMGAVAAAAVLAALLVGLEKKHPAINQAGGEPVVNEQHAAVPAPEIADQPPVEKRMHKTAPALRRSSRPAVAASIAEPKLEQFPSSRDVSVAEERLVQYLQTAPHAALLKPHRTSEIAKLHIDDLETEPLEIRRINEKPFN